MKKSNSVKKGYALVLAALLALPCFGLLQTQAAGRIDTSRECSLTVSVEVSENTGGNEAYLEDFNRMSIPVSVYRVADVDATGQKFTPTAPFAGTGGLDMSKIEQGPSGMTAADWQELSLQAENIRRKENPEAAGTAVIRKDDGSTAAAQGKITGLTPGLYLVVPAPTGNPDYTVQYTFAPYLTALPSSDYTISGAGSDEWIYDTTIGLKPDAEPLYGKLNIIKTLQNYNESLGQATFVFQITGVDKNGVTKYEEVESMTFSAAGSNTVTLERIPAGLTVTVTEVYSGASYTIEGSDTDTALIWSDLAVEAGVGQEASVEFANRYDGGNRSGYGVTNHFASDGNGGWIWENPTTAAGE
ncbi:MAG: hypothetical protein HFG80_12250 [Eubacterium sp.]|nr:hypothetical protein [Eubacterium sp.]